MKTTSFLLLMLFSILSVFSQSDEEIYEDETYIDELTAEQVQFLVDSINNSFTYNTGTVTLLDGVAQILVPEGYKFLDAEQSEYVLADLWGNPPSPTLGLLFPVNAYPIGETMTYAVEVNFEEEGYIEDEDAADIDYDELEEEMIESFKESNIERKKLGYEGIEFVGWATPPYYDSANKKLHWAKELAFEGTETNTLNYEIRILGRKGYLDMNAIGDIDVLPLFNKDIKKVLASVNFNEGHRYEDFDSSMDKVAAYGIGGLIAGKVLAKVGFFAIIAKFGKFIIIGIIGLFAAFKNKLFGRKPKETVTKIEE